MNRHGSLIGTILLGFLIYLPFMLILLVADSINASAFFGLFSAIEILILGLPWNLPIAILALMIEDYLPPHFFQSLSVNHDRTTGWCLFIGYVSVFINCLIISILIRNRKG
jgi:hypothetical protein